MKKTDKKEKTKRSKKEKVIKEETPKGRSFADIKLEVYKNEMANIKKNKKLTEKDANRLRILELLIDKYKK